MLRMWYKVEGACYLVFMLDNNGILECFEIKKRRSLIIKTIDLTTGIYIIGTEHFKVYEERLQYFSVSIRILPAYFHSNGVACK